MYSAESSDIPQGTCPRSLKRVCNPPTIHGPIRTIIDVSSVVSCEQENPCTVSSCDKLCTPTRTVYTRHVCREYIPTAYGQRITAGPLRLKVPNPDHQRKPRTYFSPESFPIGFILCGRCGGTLTRTKRKGPMKTACPTARTVCGLCA